MPNYELLEVHRSKSSLHHAKTGYDYPTIRLPHTFSKLAGLPTRIYRTVYDGALAFLVVLSATEESRPETEFWRWASQRHKFELLMVRFLVLPKLKTLSVCTAPSVS